MRHIHFGRAAKGVQVVLFGMLILAMGACDDLLEVELPHLLTGDAIEGAGTAETQLNSAIALFECGYSEWATMTLGPEDAMQSIAGVGGGTHGYDHTPNTGSCDTSSSSTSWFDNIMGARALLSTAPERLVATGTGSGRGVYDRIQDEWSLGQPGERLSAIAAIYVAASIGHMGEFLCEGAIDVSDLLTPAQMLDVADDWVDRAIGHINAFGDFAMPFGISADARNMALAIRARILWANGDLAGAAAAATTVLNDDPNFVAWVTRETGSTRRNKSFHMLTDVSFSGMLGVNTWWDGSIRSPNPATGQEWPNPIPFTGYLFLGILPDGETLVDVTDASGYFPVQWAADARDANEDPVALGNGAVADTRVPHIY
ncbi:MAG TPA: hypothetical protein VLA09_01615, partial [Longimicrobiales bacterium]|nr:hypothetical protein [Longimicrobiales bacterium]